MVKPMLDQSTTIELSWGSSIRSIPSAHWSWTGAPVSRSKLSRAAVCPAWASGSTCVGLDAVAAAPAAIARPQQSLELTLRRTRGRVDGRVGAGLDTRAERQRHDSDVWIARLRAQPARWSESASAGSAEALICSVCGWNRQSGIDLVVKARFGSTVPKPEISSNGQD